MLQTVISKTRKRKPRHWSALLNKSLERPPNATCWPACHDVLQLLLKAVAPPTPLCQRASKCADQKRRWARAAPVMESIQIKFYLRLVSKAPHRALGMLASKPWLNVHVIGGVRRPGCLLLLTRTAELRGRHDVSRVAFISSIAHVDHRTPAVVQTLCELLSPETGNDATRARRNTSNIEKQLRSQCPQLAPEDAAAPRQRSTHWRSQTQCCSPSPCASS